MFVYILILFNFLMTCPNGRIAYKGIHKMETQYRMGVVHIEISTPILLGKRAPVSFHSNARRMHVIPFPNVGNFHALKQCRAIPHGFLYMNPNESFKNLSEESIYRFCMLQILCTLFCLALGTQVW